MSPSSKRSPEKPRSEGKATGSPPVSPHPRPHPEEPLSLAGHTVPLGTTRDLELPVSRSYSGTDVALPLRIERAARPGPVVLALGAIHGYEINGTGIVRQLAVEPGFTLEAGTLILVPVVNILGFERLSRYLPDRRDLNRSFPGSASGSLTSRFAHTIFHQLVRQSDFCVDFHTAAVRRTNFPNVRADLGDPAVARLARAFGCSLIIDHPGIQGSLRLAACQDGCPTITIEAGEVWKIESAVVELGLRGVRNVLLELGMIQGEPEAPAYLAEANASTWVRADDGGILSFHIAPGDLVDKGQPVASITTLLGVERQTIHSPADGVVLGITTLPIVKPGDPVCHVALPDKGIARIRRALSGIDDESLHERLRDDLATSVNVVEHEV